MRLDLFPDSSMVDDLVVDDASLLVTRAGEARYCLRFESKREAVFLDLWTTRKGTIDFKTQEDVPPWMTALFLPDGTLAVLMSVPVTAHLEHLDRGLYWLGLRSIDEWSGTFSTRGYLKTRVLHRSLGAARMPGEFCDECRSFVPSVCTDNSAALAHIRAICHDQPSLAMAELAALTGLSSDDARVWVEHAGRPRSSQPGPLCPFCMAVLPTSRSRQCLRCKADWHWQGPHAPRSPSQ